MAAEPVRKWLLSQTVNRQTILDWTPARAIEEMDQNGIATAVSSIAVPGVWFEDVALGRRLARDWNDYGASLARQYPGRFGLFATIPLPDTEGSLEEIEYALGVLKADGIGLFTSYGDKYPGDPSFAPVFEELNRRKAVVYFHPTTPACCRGLTPGVPAPLIEYPTDTTRAIMHILLSGLAARLPDIRFIFSHAGGTMTAAVGRFASLIPNTESLAQRMPHGLEYELAKFYYDTANSAAAITMNALMKLVPVSHILLGTDSPYVPVSVTADALEALGLSSEDLQAIETNNALALLPRLKA
jgi:predicted TIM-barrel fold metal-dependent hydrolase